MFGMTKKQFLKRSKKTLNQTGGLLLLIRGIMVKESSGNINNEELSKQIDSIRKNIESIFFEFEKINPPSKYVTMHLRILRALVDLQEVVTLNSEYLSTTKDSLEEKTKNKLKESRDRLEKFRKEFHSLANEVNTLLEK
jgi:chromosome segregation ATPase